MLSTNNVKKNNDVIVLKQLEQTFIWLKVCYDQAPPHEKNQLWEPLEQALNAYYHAHIEIFKPGNLCTDADVKQMKQIQKQIEAAAQTQTLILALVKLIAFLAKF